MARANTVSPQERLNWLLRLLGIDPELSTNLRHTERLTAEWEAWEKRDDGSAEPEKYERFFDWEEFGQDKYGDIVRIPRRAYITVRAA